MLKTIRNGNQALVLLEGELDHCCAQRIRSELDLMLSDPALMHMILDFSQLNFMDSSGIGVILGRYRLLRDRGGTLSVTRMNRHVARIFHMSGMDKIIQAIDQEVRV